MEKVDVEEILREDERRRRALSVSYDPIAGGVIGERVKAVFGGRVVMIPRSMKEDPEYCEATSDPVEWERLRCRHDFEFWCVRCVKVRHKVTGQDVPFILNAPQRRVAGVLEAQRMAGKPIRMILLKARQWGGSTLTQMYMAWIQSCHRRNWHSLICAHVKDTSAGIRGMYSKLLSGYPQELWEGDAPPLFKPFERATNVREIVGRGCRVTIGSGEAQDSVRGADYSMAHLSETAFWPNTRTHTPQAFIRAICGAIMLEPLTLIVMESTANGIGDYFHSEWLRCSDPDNPGDKQAVFVPWYEIEYYRAAPPDRASFAASFSDYEQRLWNLGLSLDQIWWYRIKSREYPTAEEMQAEFPTTDVEAFMTTGRGVFGNAQVAELRRTCVPPVKKGDVNAAGTEFLEDNSGPMKLWSMPERGRQYVVSVDVGGRSAKSDWSVVAVLACPGAAGEPAEVVAQWRGHVDHDLLAAKSVAVARYYNEALLVIESNTYETSVYGGTGGDGGGGGNLFILNRIADVYGNVYRRESFDSVSRTTSWRVGFHTNRQTKALLIDCLIEAVRECSYVERDAEACNEMLTYEQLSNGSFAARDGRHDDILMTRAMALYIISTRPTLSPSPFTTASHIGW